jgi:ethanolamine utilization protein EutQ
MQESNMSVRHFTRNDAKYYRYRDRDIVVGDVLDASGSDSMSVGYYRNAKKGEGNAWVVTYDEALVVVRGALTVRSDAGAQTAKAGEVIFLTKGTAVTYEAAEDDTEVVYVTYPHWLETHARSEHAHLLEDYQPA